MIPDHPHHVVLRGNNRRRLFSYPREHRLFLRVLAESSRLTGVPVHTNVQMSNHVHLIVTPRDHRQLSRFVGRVAQRYAQVRNRARRSSGKLFEERYKSFPIVTEEQMAVVTVYVELNPVKAGLCREARQYRWSTFRRHAGLAPKEPWVEKLWTPSSWFLSLGPDPAERSRAFIECFEDYRARDEWSGVHREPPAAADRGRFERPDRRSVV